VDLNFGVFLDRLPTGCFWKQLLHLVGKQWRDAASARYAWEVPVDPLGLSPLAWSNLSLGL